MAIEALDAALADAGPDTGRIEAIFFANALSGLLTGQECVRGQVALRHSRYGGIPTVNVENACASGSTALHLACMAIDAGVVRDRRRRRLGEDVAPGQAPVDRRRWRARPTSTCSPTRPRITASSWTATPSAPAAGSSATAGAPADFARVVVKNRRHAVHNPGAQFRKEMTVDEVLVQPDDHRAAHAADVLADRRRRRRAHRDRRAERGRRADPRARERAERDRRARAGIGRAARERDRARAERPGAPRTSTSSRCTTRPRRPSSRPTSISGWRRRARATG